MSLAVVTGGMGRNGPKRELAPDCRETKAAGPVGKIFDHAQPRILSDGHGDVWVTSVSISVVH